MEETLTYSVKLYKGTVENMASQYGHDAIRMFKFALQLKALYPYAYISKYKKQIPFIARILGISRRTVVARIQRLMAPGFYNNFRFAYMEGATLRILSDKHIKKHFAKQTGHRQDYKWITLANIATAVELQPISENTKQQERAIGVKKRNNSNQIAKCQSLFRDQVKNSPNAKMEIVDTTLMSQQKAATLLGYRSKASGYRLLKRLAMAKSLELESNTVELTREEFNRYKEVHSHRLLIRGRGC